MTGGPGHISELVNRAHHKTAQVTAHTQPHQHPLLLWAHIKAEATSVYSLNALVKGKVANEKENNHILLFALIDSMIWFGGI